MAVRSTKYVFTVHAARDVIPDSEMGRIMGDGVTEPQAMTQPHAVRWFGGQLEMSNAQAAGDEYLHFQGAVVFKHAISFQNAVAFVRGLFIPDWWVAPHVEIARGTFKDIVAYVTKEATRVRGPWEIGERLNQGKRSDLMCLADYAKRTSTRTTRDLLMTAKEDGDLDKVVILMGRYPNLASSMMNLYSLVEDTPAPTPKKNFWIWGAPGVGKTTWVNNYIKEHELTPIWMGRQSMCQFNQRNEATHLWFPSTVTGKETCLVLDDCLPGLDASLLRSLISDGPVVVQSKGGERTCHYDTVFILSNSPSTTAFWDNNSLESKSALDRLTRVIHITAPESRRKRTRFVEYPNTEMIVLTDTEEDE